MSKFEEILKENAFYGGPGEVLKKSPIKDFVDIKNLKPIGQGLNTRVFKIPNSNWAMKEGRWDLDFNLFENLNIKIPAQLTENFLQQFEISFLPNKEEIKRQYLLYIEFAKYFGYFNNKNSYFHPERKKIASVQEKTRSKLEEFLPDLDELFSLNNQDDLIKVLKSPAIQTNFLPKEYLLYGDSFSEENEGKETYYIFQEFVEGRMLHDLSIEDLSKVQQEKVLLIAYLVLLMSVTKELVPDLRPRYFVKGGINWFSNTDNIIITEDDVKFIDTRWMWNMNDNVVKRGILIPELTLDSTKKFINKALKIYSNNND